MTICFKFNFIHFKTFTELEFYVLQPRTTTAKATRYTKCLVSDFVSNAQSRALKKLKMDSNSRCGHDITKRDKKDLETMDPVRF